MFNWLIQNKEFKKLKVGDVLASPVDSEAVRAGFTKYAEIENFYKIIDINENGIIYNRYLGKPYSSLPVGYMFDDAFYDAEFVNRWIETGRFVVTDGTELQTILDKDK